MPSPVSKPNSSSTRAYIGTEVTESAVFFGFSASVQLAGSPETLFGLLGIARASETTNAENWADSGNAHNSIFSPAR